MWEININDAWFPLHSEEFERRHRAYLRQRGSAYYETPRAAISFASMIAATTMWDQELKRVVSVTCRIRRTRVPKQ